MMTRRPSPLHVVLAAALLAGCAGHPPGPRAVDNTGAPPPASDAQGIGSYKVGNPYQIAGVWYRPAEDYAYDETGIASWYGEDFHGKYTANGEIFDLNAMTAAHRTLPMPSIVQVTNLDNGRTVVLRVNDRGPFARGRIIDVSRRAAQLLGFENQGTAKVRVRIMVPETIQAVALARRNGSDQKVADDTPHAAPRDAVVAEALQPGSRVAAIEPSAHSAAPPPTQAALLAAPQPTMPVSPSLAAVSSVPPPAPMTPTVLSRTASSGPPQPSLVASLPPAVAAAPAAARPLPETVTVVPVKSTQIYIQAGAYARADNALRTKARLDAIGPAKVYGARVNGVDVYRVRLGPIDSVDEADKLLGRVVETGLTEARIVVD
jgi:rare lipoprotein A